MEIEYSKKGARQFSQFVVDELLYDYIVGQLDAERTRGVEEGLKIYPESKKKYLQMKRALEYTQKLRKVQVSGEAIENLYEPSNYFSMLFKKTQFEKWPSTVKWSMEALVVFAGIILFLVVVPWESAIKSTLTSKDRDIVLTEISKNPQHLPKETLAEVEKKETPQFSDEVKKPLPPQTQEVSTVVASQQPEASQPKTSATETQKDDSKAKSGGFLYRGELSVTNVDMVAPKIRDKIVDLGGRKAGDVEIGWKRGTSTYYYHFTIPEAKYNELLNFLGEYSKAKLNKEKHPRVMPDGIIRLIITVDEKAK